MVNIIASGTITDTDGNVLTVTLAQDPNGSDKIQLLTRGATGKDSAVAEISQAGGNRATGRLIDCAGSTDVVTDPATGFITGG